MGTFFIFVFGTFVYLVGMAAGYAKACEDGKGRRPRE